MCRICHTPSCNWLKNLGCVGVEFTLQLTFGAETVTRHWFCHRVPCSVDYDSLHCLSLVNCIDMTLIWIKHDLFDIWKFSVVLADMESANGFVWRDASNWGYPTTKLAAAFRTCAAIFAQERKMDNLAWIATTANKICADRGSTLGPEPPQKFILHQIIIVNIHQHLELWLDTEFCPGKQIAPKKPLDFDQIK